MIRKKWFQKDRSKLGKSNIQRNNSYSFPESLKDEILNSGSKSSIQDKNKFIQVRAKMQNTNDKEMLPTKEQLRKLKQNGQFSRKI